MHPPSVGAPRLSVLGLRRSGLSFLTRVTWTKCDTRCFRQMPESFGEVLDRVLKGGAEVWEISDNVAHH